MLHHKMTAQIIIDQIDRMDWIVSVHRINGTVEMHAVKITNPDDFHVARCNDGEGDDYDYRCACLLAEAVGIELEDG